MMAGMSKTQLDIALDRLDDEGDAGTDPKVPVARFSSAI
jgi:hypothetical protein